MNCVQYKDIPESEFKYMCGASIKYSAGIDNAEVIVIIDYKYHHMIYLLNHLVNVKIHYLVLLLNKYLYLLMITHKKNRSDNLPVKILH